MIRRRCSQWSVAVLLAASVASAQTAPAPPPSGEPGRRELIDLGLHAREGGDHARALELFTRAGRIEMRPGLRMSIAEEQQSLGQPRLACETASRCVEDVQADLGRPESARVLQGCAQLVSATCAQVGRVRLRLPTPLGAGFRVSVQGRGLDAGAVVATVDPGEVPVEASDGAGGAFREVFVVRRGETRELSVVLHARADGATATATVAAPGVAPTPEAHPAVPPSRPPTDASESRGAGAGPWIVGGIGVAAFATAAGLWWGLGGAARGDVDAACPAAVMSCNPSAADALSRGQTAALAANVAIGVGSAAVVGGALWWLLGRRASHPARASAFVAPIPSGGLAQVAVTF